MALIQEATARLPTESLVNHERLLRLWPKVSELLQTVPGGYCDLTDYFDRIADGRFQLWVDSDEVNAIAVGEMIQFPRKKIYSLFVVTGKGRHDWQERVKEIEAYAKAWGCDAMHCKARKGWERVMKPFGYEATHVCLEKTL